MMFCASTLLAGKQSVKLKLLSIFLHAHAVILDQLNLISSFLLKHDAGRRSLFIIAEDH